MLDARNRCCHPSGPVSTPAVAAAQDTTCPAYEGITCDGYVTDAAGVIEDDARLEEAVGRVVESRGNQVAVVMVPDTGGHRPMILPVDWAMPGASAPPRTTTA